MHTDDGESSGKGRNRKSLGLDWGGFGILWRSYYDGAGVLVYFYLKRMLMFTWIAVKELKLNFYSKETLLCVICPYYGNLI